jgi:hypothetical protein
MNIPCDFNRLVEVVELIARHPPYPGKQETAEQCREELDELHAAGRITAGQRDQLRSILAGTRPRPRVGCAAWR